MPVELRVTCVNKSDPLNPQSHILGIGGVDDLGTPWYLSQDQAIAAIDERQFKFIVIVSGWRAKVIAEHGPEGRYLRIADGSGSTTLSSLPPCP